MLPLASLIPFYSYLNDEHRLALQTQCQTYTVSKGTFLADHDTLCLGLFFVLNGQLRSFIRHADGKEITLFRLLDHDGCILGATCSLKNISFDIRFYVEADTTLLVIPAKLYESLQERYPAVKDFALAMMSTRLSEVMWIVEQFAFHSLDKRLATALLAYSALQETDEIIATHEEIAQQIGSAREVVSRTLKYFEQEGYVTLSRKKICILQRKELTAVSDR